MAHIFEYSRAARGAGCGGLGGYLIEMLLRLGVGTIRAADGDVFESSGSASASAIWKRRIRHHAFGNVREQCLGEIWNGEEYRAFRQRVHEFKFAPCLFCGGCLWGQGFAVCP